LCGATAKDIPARLAAYERIRINRASAIQVLSNAGQDEVELTYKEAAKYVGSEEAVPSEYMIDWQAKLRVCSPLLQKPSN
jgi:hypothetical protein